MTLNEYWLSLLISRFQAIPLFPVAVQNMIDHSLHLRLSLFSPRFQRPITRLFDPLSANTLFAVTTYLHARSNKLSEHEAIICADGQNAHTGNDVIAIRSLLLAELRSSTQRHVLGSFSQAIPFDSV